MTSDKPDKATPSGQQTPARQRDATMPSAGPHDKPELTNPDATPGAGTLPEPGSSNPSDADSSG